MTVPATGMWVCLTVSPGGLWTVGANQTPVREAPLSPIQGQQAGRGSGVNVCIPNAQGLPADTDLQRRLGQPTEAGSLGTARPLPAHRAVKPPATPPPARQQPGPGAETQPLSHLKNALGQQGSLDLGDDPQCEQTKQGILIK